MHVERMRVTPGLIERIRPLAEAHYAATPLPPGGLDIDVDLHVRLDQAGVLRAWLASSDVTGDPMGYAVYVIGPALKRRGERVAMCDSLTGGSAATAATIMRAIMAVAERALADEGIVRVAYQQPEGNAALAAVYARSGATPSERIWLKGI